MKGIWFNLLLGILFVCFSNGLLPGQTVFHKTYDYNVQINSGTSVLEVDSGYIFVGQTVTGSYRAIVLVKTDLKGDTLWSKKYGQAPLIYYSGLGGSLINTDDGGFAVGGSIKDTSGGDSQALLIKFDNNGDTLWSKTYGGTGYDVAYKCRQTKDGGYVLIGQTKSFGEPNGDVYLVKTDEKGDTLWTKTYGGGNLEDGFSIEITDDDGYIIGGYTNSFGEGVYVIKIDSTGKKEWQKVIGINIPGLGGRIIQTKDKGYLIETAKDNSGGKGWQGYLAKLDSSGSMLWDRTFGGNNYDWFEQAIELVDGSIVAIGASESNNQNTPFGWLVKTNSSGDSLWSKTYYTRSDIANYFRDIKPTKDNGFIICGFAFRSNQDAWLVKIDSLGNTCEPVGCHDMISGIDHSNLEVGQDIRVFPNPFGISTTIQIPSSLLNSGNNSVSLVLINILGITVKTFETPSNEITLHRGNLPSGMYFYTVKIDEQIIESGKLVVE